MPLILDIDEMKALSKKRRAKRPMPVRSPIKAEMALRRKMEQIWALSIFPAVQRIKKAITNESNYEDLAALMEKELRIAEKRWGTESIDIIDMWRQMVSQETRSTMHKALARSLGVDLAAVYDSPQVAEAMTLGSFEAAGLIKTLPKDMLGKVQQAVMANMTGQPLPAGRSLLEQINYTSGKENFKKRAKLIARDQTAKMTSLLNQTRQEMIGIKMYIWRTARDQRVVGKPSGLYPKGNKAHGNHWVMEGKVCRWDDATVYSIDKGRAWKKRTGEMPKVHPGQDIQCRCYAEAVIDIKEILKYAQAA